MCVCVCVCVCVYIYIRTHIRKDMTTQLHKRRYDNVDDIRMLMTLITPWVCVCVCVCVCIYAYIYIHIYEKIPER